MPITAEDAWNATNPQDSDEARQEAAQRIMAGVAANDAYWDSRSDLEALRARAEGHGVVSRGGEPDQPHPDAVEGTAVEEPAAATAAPETPSLAPTAETPGATPAPATDDAAAKLRQQLRDAGINPEA